MATDVMERIDVALLIPDQKEIPAEHLDRPQLYQHQSDCHIAWSSNGSSYLKSQVIASLLKPRNEAGNVP